MILLIGMKGGEQMDAKKKEILGVIIRVAVALALFVAAIVNYDKLAHINVEQELSKIDNTGALIAVALLMYFVKGLIFILPASVLYMGIGTILPPLVALGVNMLGIAIEVTATYLLGVFLGGELVNKILSKNKAGQKILAIDLQNKKSIIFTTRLLPVFPIDLLSLFYGASKSKFPLYFILSVLGIAPRIILFTIIGDNIFKWIPMDKLIFIVICCIPVGVVVYLIKKFVIEKKQKKN